jgi:hypothetical protein
MTDGTTGMTGMTRCTFIPPYILERLASDPDPTIAAHAREALEHDEHVRRQRRGLPSAWVQEPGPGPGPHPGPGPEPGGPDAGPSARRTISDARGQRRTPGHRARSEGEAPTGDPAVDEAYDGLGATWRLWFEVFGRDSLDGKGLPLLATVHYGAGYDNAFWDGSRMVFGDGDGVVFERFTRSLDVIGHELAHGVTEHTAGLIYRGQPGALNESLSDVFGVLVRQYLLGQSADEADWLVGADLFTPGVRGRALRDMREPGTAYDDPRLGSDPQPAHMDDFVVTTDDHGGVHVNSGIPNRAFVLAALSLGGPAWQTAGAIWHAAVVGDGIAADCDFATFAGLTLDAAARLHGESSPESAKVRSAWETVGVLSPIGLEPRAGGQTGDEGRDEGAEAVPDDTTEEVHGEVPADETEVLLRRTGGFAGLTKERRLALGELPDREARSWRQLLAAPTLAQIARDQTTHPDAYCYEVSCNHPEVHVTVAEPHLPEAIHSLFERTLED